MKKHKLYFLTILFLLPISWMINAQSINIIPYPVQVTQGKGEFILTSNTTVICDQQLLDAGELYTDILNEVLGFSLRMEKKASKNPSILLTLDKKSTLPIEGYTLNISPEKVEISAPSSKGIVYGMQSLVQLISPQAGKKEIKLPEVEITDYPRFGWRGIMLDVSRTFMGKNLVKRYIDLMSLYKLNTLHFHFSDDQGWRIEIKKYPKLTTVGSKFDIEFNEMGGYYTQEDIRDLVAYAAQRNITIVPEFELPGHACAVLTSYPDLSCTGIPPGIHSFFKGPSVHKEILCGGKPEVYEFVNNVLDELIELFPSQYIHIGGDEAPKEQWKKCEHCQKKMRENNLTNEEQLQSYFVTQVGNHLRSKGRVLVGWDEILEGGKLTGDEVVMYWRSWAKTEAEHAAAKGFKIISCPTSHCYFDYGYEAIDTKKVYLYDPVPEGTPQDVAANYLGVQANFWSHIAKSESRIDKQLFPRLFALSEVGWGNPENKNWERFKGLARIHNELLRSLHVNGSYDDTIYDPE